MGKEKTVERKALYDQIWKEPVVHVAKKYGISDVGLRKICKKLWIPLPPLGYWAKKAVGKAPPRPKLPPLPAGEDDSATIYGSTSPTTLGENPTETELKAAAEKLDENRIVVPDTVARWHPLVELTATSLKSAKPGADGLVRPAAKHSLDVAISPGLVPRGMRILDAMLKALPKRGMKICFEKSDKVNTYIAVANARVQIKFEEAFDRVELPKEKKIHQWSEQKEYGKRCSGRLGLRVESYSYAGRKSWFESANKPLESLLNNFLAAVLRCAEAQGVQRHQNTGESSYQRERRIKTAHRKLELLDEKRRKELDLKLAAWQKCVRLRALVAAVEKDAKKRGLRIAPDNELGKWLSWARQFADEIDPTDATTVKYFHELMEKEIGYVW